MMMYFICVYAINPNPEYRKEKQMYNSKKQNKTKKTPDSECMYLLVFSYHHQLFITITSMDTPGVETISSLLWKPLQLRLVYLFLLTQLMNISSVRYHLGNTLTLLLMEAQNTKENSFKQLKLSINCNLIMEKGKKRTKSYYNVS